MPGTLFIFRELLVHFIVYKCSTDCILSIKTREKRANQPEQPMKALIEIGKKSPSMTSVQIAELTGKQHKHVMLDVKVLEEQGAIDGSNFGLEVLNQTTIKEKRMNLDDLTIGQAKQLAALLGNSKQSDNSAWEIGKGYLIRTVTMTNTGRLVAVTEQELVLKDAAWVADTGRFSDALKSCNFDEVEPFPDGKVIIGRGAIVDAVQVEVLPRAQK